MCARWGTTEQVHVRAKHACQYRQASLMHRQAHEYKAQAGARPILSASRNNDATWSMGNREKMATLSQLLHTTIWRDRARSNTGARESAVVQRKTVRSEHRACDEGDLIRAQRNYHPHARDDKMLSEIAQVGRDVTRSGILEGAASSSRGW